MDLYGHSTPDQLFRIDDLLDFSNDQIFSSSSISDDSNPTPQPPDFVSSSLPPHSFSTTSAFPSPEFTDDFYFPSDDVAELEWLSQFVDDSFSDIPANSVAGTVDVHSDGVFAGRPRGKRSRSVAPSSTTGKSKPARHEIDAAADTAVRRCTHCASEKTPQWRTGPLGPKTLCNACGVRFKSGRLVPEYRPAASPTFVLTQHSNSHRKVMELRRQKEVMKQRQQEQQIYRHHHHHHHHHHSHQTQQHDFQVC